MIKRCRWYNFATVYLRLKIYKKTDQLKMKQKLLLTLAVSGLCLSASAQQVKFTEYDLDNGLHVILHQDKTDSGTIGTD